MEECKANGKYRSVAGIEQIVNTFVFAVGFAFFHLFFKHFSVVTLSHGTDNTDSYREVATHTSQHHVYAGIFCGLIVNHNVVHCDTVFANGYRFEAAAVETEAFVAVFTINHWFTMFQYNGAVVANSAVGDGGMSLVVENHAVLQYLNNRSAVVFGGLKHNLGG